MIFIMGMEFMRPRAHKAPLCAPRIEKFFIFLRGRGGCAYFSLKRKVSKRNFHKGLC